MSTFPTCSNLPQTKCGYVPPFEMPTAEEMARLNIPSPASSGQPAGGMGNDHVTLTTRHRSSTSGHATGTTVNAAGNAGKKPSLIEQLTAALRGG
jgi:hypothetical protein